VQEARINVHPAELGPISVQIALDGTAAQVHLAVDNAQTRELLEQAMPTLAAALRDTGLTLTGGGVFQQSRQSQQEQAGADPRGTDRGRLLGDDADADLARMAAATPRRLRPLGALDVFA
jgi:flagellar hook-length control protein FliK